MSLANESQLLIRNIEHIGAKTPLFVNFPADTFISEYFQYHPQAKASCYHTNFEQFNAIQTLNSALTNAQVDYQFCTEYQTDTQHDVIIIQFPKSKAELAFTLSMLSQYALSNSVASNGESTRVFIVGNNKSGIKSVEKLSKNILAFCNKIDSARHCSIYCSEFLPNLPHFVLENWFSEYQFTIGEQSITVSSLPGVFSQQHLDKGTELLLNNLPEKLEGKVLDFGCGAGVISSFIGKTFPSTQLSLVDVSALALTSSQRTLKLNGLSGQFIASNSLSNVSGKYQHVLSNPPFHQGVKTNYVATETFLGAIKKHIEKNGTITIVANSFLQYQPIMQKFIGHTVRVCNSHGFAVYLCKHV